MSEKALTRAKAIDNAARDILVIPSTTPRTVRAVRRFPSDAPTHSTNSSGPFPSRFMASPHLYVCPKVPLMFQLRADSDD